VETSPGVQNEQEPDPVLIELVRVDDRGLFEIRATLEPTREAPFSVNPPAPVKPVNKFTVTDVKVTGQLKLGAGVQLIGPEPEKVRTPGPELGPVDTDTAADATMVKMPTAVLLNAPMDTLPPAVVTVTVVEVATVIEPNVTGAVPVLIWHGPAMFNAPAVSGRSALERMPPLHKNAATEVSGVRNVAGILTVRNPAKPGGGVQTAVPVPLKLRVAPPVNRPVVTVVGPVV
jgi:hypothetical protein